ncbi:MAG TPA: hypothetical protein VMB81_18940 [Candidatus Sulfotelmatobacter sp.]|nr:hypothetical protein [Candidatus Sulfotelmatobacter sp.]
MVMPLCRSRLFAVIGDATVPLFLAVASTACSVPSPAGAADPGPPPRPAIGEFERAGTGTGIECRITSRGALTDEILQRLGPQPCLHIGDVSVGDARQRVERVIGSPYGAPVRREADVVVQIYLLHAANTNEHHVPFYAITYNNRNFVSEVQLTGPATQPPVGFTGIHLGDPVSVVTDRLGPPTKRQPVPDNGTELWDYAPFLVSFEIKDGAVFSIKVAYRRTAP